MQTLYSRQTFLFKDGKSQASLSHKSQNCISVNVTTPEQFDASFKLTRIKPRTKPVAKQNNLKILQLTNLKIYNSKIKCEILVFHSRLPTFSTFLSRISFMSLQRLSNLALSSSIFFFSSSSSGSSRPSLVTETRFLPSNSFSCWTQYSSMGSVMYRTSKPRLRTRSTKAELATWSLLSPECRHKEVKLCYNFKVCATSSPLLILTSDVVDGLLVLLHAGEVLCEGGHLVSRLGAVVTQQFWQLFAVLRVLMDTKLQEEQVSEALVRCGKVITGL